MPPHIAPLFPELIEELKDIALFVGQNEFATIGPRENTCPYIYSTGFFRCVGVVLFDGASLIATLAHVAPATAAEMSVDRIKLDFEKAGGALDGAKTVAFLFGGRDQEADKEKRRALTEALGEIPVRHVPLSELGIDSGWGFYFNRVTGAFAAVHGSPVEMKVFGAPELSLMSNQRANDNISNDNRSAKAELLLATRY